MVVFTCNHCGDSVKKPAVDKHYNTKCRGTDISVSCMDCQKDFYGKEHVAHTKCISEAEKYSAKGFVPKESKNTNAKKQDSWINVVRSILDSTEYKMKPRTREAFQKLSTHENVPRKKAKFENFTSKCVRLPQPVVAEVWHILEMELKKMDEERKKELEEKKQKTEAAKSNGVKRANDDTEHSAEPAKKKKKKQKNQEQEEIIPAVVSAVEEEAGAEATDDFKWEEVLQKITKKGGTEGIAVEKLKNKALKKYKSKLAVEEMSDKQQNKFAKKFKKHLKKCTNIVVTNDVAKIA